MSGEGILFTVSTTNFDEAIELCEKIFDDCTTDEWTDEWMQVKNSKDFKELSNFLKANDIDNKLFVLNNE
jgi:uncharacterized protein YozE (UPF0346 family)